jgi:hypothetical protein
VATEIAPERLAEMVARTLEDAAFVFTEPADPSATFGAPVLEARLEFEGPTRGELALTTTRAVARGLAANLLGLEPGDRDIEVRAGDALGEIVNMLAGAVVLELFGPAAQTRIGVPAVRELAGAPGPGSGTTVSLATEDGDRLDAAVRQLGGGPP